MQRSFTVLFIVLIFSCLSISAEAQSAKDTVQIIRWSEMLTGAPFYKQDSLLNLAINKSVAINRKDYVVRIYQLWSFFKIQQNKFKEAERLGARAVAVGLTDPKIKNHVTVRDAMVNLAMCYFYTSKVDSSLYWLKEVKNQSREIDNFNYSIALSLEAALLSNVLSKPTVLQLYDSALVLAGTTDDLHDDIMAAFNKAEVLQSIGGNSWGEAIELLISYHDKVDDPLLVRVEFSPDKRFSFKYRNPKNSLYSILGLHYFLLSDIETACYYQNKVVENYRRDNNPYLPYPIFDLAMYHTFLPNSGQALQLFDSASSLIAQQLKTTFIPYPSFLYVAGWKAEIQNNLQEAIYYYKAASGIREPNYPHISMPALFRVLVKANKMSDADSIRNIKLGSSALDAYVSILFQKELATYYKRMGRNDLYLKQQLKYFERKDSLTTAARYYTVKEAETRFKTKEKEKELAVAQKEKELQARELERKKMEAIFMVAGMVVLVSLSVALFKNYRVKKQQATELAVRNERIETLIRELHHRVKNNMQTISSLLSLQSFRLKDENAKAALKEGQTRIEAMALIHQKLYMDSDLRGVNMEEYLTALVGTLAQSYGYETDIVKQEINLIQKNLDVDVAIPLGLIINELVTNSFKYAFDTIAHPELQLMLRSTEGKNIELMVRDNGKGLPESAIADSPSGSFGLKLVRTLSKQLNGTLITRNEQGAVFHLVVNLQA